MTIRAITLWQPHASFVAVGLTSYETRSWYTLHRGLLIIHAAKKNDDDTYIDWFDYCARFDLKGLEYNALPFGAAICAGQLVACIPTEGVPRNERTFGNFSGGRFAWKLTDVEVFPEPIPCSGAQGFWHFTKPFSYRGRFYNQRLDEQVKEFKQLGRKVDRHRQRKAQDELDRLAKWNEAVCGGKRGE